MTLPFADIHTHRLDAGPDAVICVDPSETPLPELRADRHYSVGIHPWRAHLATPEAWAELGRLAASPLVVAIGEAGLDTLRGPALAEVQTPVFVRQAELAETLGKPLIIHAVRSWQQLIALRRSMRPSVPWIIHGFRGNPQLARQLLDHGFDLSLGPRHNPATLAIIPPHRLHRESDAT